MLCLFHFAERPVGSVLKAGIAAGLCAVLLACGAGQVQAQESQRPSSSVNIPAPQREAGTAVQEQRADRPTPAGTGLPPAARPADPPSTFGRSSGGRITQQGTPSKASPGTPSDPTQTPIGGLGWLAAAGAAYALHRLGLQSEEG